MRSLSLQNIRAMGVGKSASIALPAIGTAMGGGFVAGYISLAGNGVASHMLIVSPKTTGETALAWDSTGGGATTGLTSAIDGPGNTAAMVALGARYAAATWCDGLTIGGFTDWYLPAKHELETAYFNLKNVTQDNFNPYNYGSNPYAVPPEPISTTYTATVPSQTTVAAFKTGGSEAFSELNFWVSTEISATDAWAMVWTSVYPSYQVGSTKTNPGSLRAFRRVAI